MLFRTSAAVAVAALMACVRYPMGTCPDLGAFARQAIVRELRDGVVIARGRIVAGNWHNSLDPDYGPVHSGEWTYWYGNGAKHVLVTYALGCYVQCCSGGPCPQLHDFPVGPFVVWYPSGHKLAEGSFTISRLHVQTSCQGGDDTMRGHISADSRFWREDGSSMTLDEARATGYLLPGW